MLAGNGEHIGLHAGLDPYLAREAIKGSKADRTVEKLYVSQGTDFLIRMGYPDVHECESFSSGNESVRRRNVGLSGAFITV